MSANLIYPHEASRVFVRPDETYAWDTAHSRWLRKYPKQVRDCNDYLRQRLSLVTPAKYAWVHAFDIETQVFDPNRNTYVTVTRVPEKYWRAPLIPQSRYFLCCLEPITSEQHALRVQRIKLINGVDLQLWTYNGRHARTEVNKLPTLALSAEAAWHISQNFKMNMAQFGEAMAKATNLADHTPRVAAEAAEYAREAVRIPSGMQSFVNAPGTFENRQALQSAGIPESPTLAKPN